ncbi:hypothetical protein [Rubripirellula lacrimiformis]|nr:hypothetical protein [Rubripirellula lacrimiformis]
MKFKVVSRMLAQRAGWGMAESLGDLRYGMMRLVESLGSETRQEFRPWMVGDGRKSWRLALRDDAVGRKSW